MKNDNQFVQGLAKGSYYSGRLSLNRSLQDIFEALELCIGNKHTVASQLLIYSTIDALSGMAFPEKNTFDRYTCWVDKWILPHEKIQCSAIDLYAARSGLIHNLALDSRLSKSGRAKKISFCYGGASFSHLVEANDGLPSNLKTACVELEALHEVLEARCKEFMSDLEKNHPERFEEVLKSQPMRIKTA